MKTTTELQLRKIALVLTALVLLQLVWSGVRLWLLATPEPIAPAEGSLQVDEIRHNAKRNDELFQDLAARPVFWQGRQAFVPVVATEEPREQEKVPHNSNIDQVALLGIYSDGSQSGVIVSYQNERRRLQQNESIAGWTFTQLGGDGPVFESGEDVRVLTLEHARSAPAPKKKSEPRPAPEETKTKKQDKTGE